MSDEQKLGGEMREEDDEVDSEARSEDEENISEDSHTENKEPEIERAPITPEETENSKNARKGRGRPKKDSLPKKGRGIPKKNVTEAEMAEIGSSPKEIDDVKAETSERKGRGRPKKVKSYMQDEELKEEEEDQNEDLEMAMEEPGEKKGRGRPRKNPADSQEKEKVKAGKKGRPKKDVSAEKDDIPEKTKTKRPKVKKERSIEPGRLRETPRLSYKDDSSDEEVNKYYEEVIVSSDSEADQVLERRLSGKGRPEKKEAGALRTRKRMSYKDESDSDIESGFESDVIAPKKSRSTSPVKKGRGRPRKSESEGKPSGKRRGRKRIHPDKGPYVPTGKPRGRPKGYKNKPKITVGKAELSAEEDKVNESQGKEKNESAKRKANASKAEKREVHEMEMEPDTEHDGENSEENSEDISDKESEESVNSDSEEEESEIKEDPVSAIGATAS